MRTPILYIACLLLLVKHSKQNDFEHENLPGNTSICCEQIYDKERFTIVSPGFPNGQLTDVDCEYRIKRAHDNVCRLKLNFNFFSNGILKNGDCLNGYIEIDGKKICGCKSGLKLIVNFDRNWENKVKVIKYKENNGFTHSVRGFSMEVCQESCVEKSDNEEISDLVGSYFNPDFHKSFYFYDPYNEDYEQESNYLAISKYDNNYNNDYKCKLIQSRYMFKLWFYNTPRCPQKTSDDDSRCVVMNSLKGSFRSSGYPFWYGNNINQCYRFIQRPGYCSVKVHMLDFQLQYSYNCNNDYLLLNNKYRYCAEELCNKAFELPFKQSYYDFFFITDNCFCGRGFAATYEQIQCKNATTTTEPTITTEISTEISTEPVTVTTTEIVIQLQPCGGTITPQQYNLQIFDYQENTCIFQVQKINKYVCYLNVNFNDFNLDCKEQYLLINETQYCGNKSGDYVKLDFNTDAVEIVYKGNNMGGRNRILSVELMQSSYNCPPDLERPPDSR